MSMLKTDNSTRTQVLIEALPYINKYRGATVVIKYGGHAMVDEALKKSFAEDVTLLKYVGINPVVVHGGGPQINNLLNRLGIKSHFVEGQRFTDQATMSIVEMVLSGSVGKEIVSLINSVGGRAVGLSGKDGQLIKAKKKKLTKKSAAAPSLPPEIIDIGLVGEPTHINTDFLHHLSTSDVIPVIAPVGVGPHGETFNINADIVAGAVAGALKAEKLMLLTDVPGVLDQDKNLIPRIKIGGISALQDKKIVYGGMIPKLACCLDAVTNGCLGAYILDGRQPHAILLEIFTDEGCGTEITS
ncbi:MAG: acetylglutamate kinase [Candidatus Adiutrix sp.]